MDRRRQSMLTLQLHQGLIGHMGALSRLVFLLHGQVIDPKVLIDKMAWDLEEQIARTSTEPTVYDAEQLRVRVRIARSVVAGIRRDVLSRG